MKSDEYAEWHLSQMIAAPGAMRKSKGEQSGDSPLRESVILYTTHLAAFGVRRSWRAPLGIVEAGCADGRSEGIQRHGHAAKVFGRGAGTGALFAAKRELTPGIEHPDL